MNVSFNYFNYEKTTKIDVKYNKNENYPLFLSIVNLLWINYYKINNENFKSCLNLQVYNKSQPYTAYKQITECPQKYGIKSIDFLINNITEEFTANNIYNYSLEFNNQIIRLESIHTIHAYYYQVQLFKLLQYSSINISEYLINNIQDDDTLEIFKLIVKIPVDRYLKTNLVLSMYNTLNDYQNRFGETSGQSCDQTIKLNKIIRRNLRPPYGDCSDYSENRPFNGTNQWHCYRQCLKTMAENRFYCKPVVIDKTTHELDFVSDNYIECDSSLQKLFDEYVAQNRIDLKCTELCPRDCVNIDFKTTIIGEIEKDEINYGNTYYSISVVWDTTQPMFVYNEELVMSFIDYIVYCGGVVGLLFGASALDIIHKILNKTFWLNIWRIILELFQWHIINQINNIQRFFRIKFLEFKQYLFQN